MFKNIRPQPQKTTLNFLQKNKSVLVQLWIEDGLRTKTSNSSRRRRPRGRRT